MAKLPKITNIYFVAMVATVGGMLFGFDISSMAAIVTTEQYIDYFDNPSGVKQDAIGSALAAGFWGRRDSTAVQVATNGFGSLVAGRSSTVSPTILPRLPSAFERRGSIIIIQQLAIERGIPIMYFIGCGCGYIEGTASLRTAWGTQFIPCVGRDQEAIQTLADMQAGGDIHDALVVAEWREISETLASERESGKGWRKFIKNGMWKRTMAELSVQAWQQLSRANVMVYYMPYVFQMANLTGKINLITAEVQDALLIVFTTVMFFFIDKTGRRSLLVWGSITMGLCHFVVGGMLGAYGEDVPGGVDGNAYVVIRVTGFPAYTVIASSYFLIIIYALTLAPVAWIYAAEVWSTGTCATDQPQHIQNLISLGMFTTPAFLNIKRNIFIVFGVLCLAAAVQAWFIYPETCGKTIEEVEELFRTGVMPAWKTKKGGSRLEAEVAAVQEAKDKGKLDLIERELPGAAEKA
ncbi:hypothetical protein BKA56DRAFT_626741 [Ilyonectria sp. MPI-CAGE-AT-0026]|nr:hypothetical protein BKA56DRAFT_626741 [Ilyonectria sp. MPI-CAGE-AT-0026]